MRAHQRLAGELVDGSGQAFGQASAVDEDERRAVGTNQLEQTRVDGGPDGWASVPDRRGAAHNLLSARQAAHVFDGHLDAEIQPFARPGIDDRHRPVAHRSRRRRELGGDCGIAARLPRLRGLGPSGATAARAGRCAASPVTARRRFAGAAQESRDLVERALGRGQADALGRPCRAFRQPLDGDSEVSAPLGRHEGMDLVDDDGIDTSEGVPGVRGQQQEKRLGGGNKDVRGVALEAGAL